MLGAGALSSSPTSQHNCQTISPVGWLKQVILSSFYTHRVGKLLTYDGHTGVSQSFVVAGTQLLQVRESVPISWPVVCQCHDVWVLRVVVLLSPECKTPLHNSLQQGRSVLLYQRGLMSWQSTGDVSRTACQASRCIAQTHPAS